MALSVITALSSIVTTYQSLSHTVDEPTHVAAGLEWLEDGRYLLHTESPPVARVMSALLPYLNGARVGSLKQRSWQFYPDVFYRTSSYRRNLTEARLATLVPFSVLLAAVWCLCGGRARPAAALAVAFTSTLPPIVAHSGLATTDIAVTAACLCALVALFKMAASPTALWSVLCGVTVGLAVTVKFSALLFLPLLASATRVAERLSRPRNSCFRRAGKKHLFLGSCAALLTVWAAYLGDTGSVDDVLTQSRTTFHISPTLLSIAGGLTIPAPGFVHGLLYLTAHALRGDATVLFGQYSHSGFALSYVTAFLVKTPLPTIIFVMVGLLSLSRTVRRPESVRGTGLMIACGLLLGCGALSSINQGIRHFLLVYPTAICAACFGFERLITEGPQYARRLWIALAIALVSIQALELSRWVPNQLGYYNQIVSGEPGYWIGDSDLDWGQDMIALGRFAMEHGIEDMYIVDRGSANPCRHGLVRPRSLPRTGPVNGWIAVFERPYWLNRGYIRLDPCNLDPRATLAVPEGWLDWLRPVDPVARIGTGVRVYRIVD